MSGTGPAASALLALAHYPNIVPPTPAAQAAGSTRNLTYNSPQPPVTTETKNLVNVINKLNRSMDTKGIIGEFEWQTQVHKVKEQTIMSATPMVFAMIKKGSSYVHLVHVVAQFGGTRFALRNIKISA